MADHAALRSQNDAAYARGVHYLAHADGWEEAHSANGVTTSVLKADQVVRIQGHVNKSPEFVLNFLRGHLATLRQKYIPSAVSTEILHRFEEDKSVIIRQENNHPAFGPNTVFEYAAPRVQADGAIDLSVNSPDLPEYPRGHSWLGFQIGRISPHDGGSNLTIVIHFETTLAVNDEQRAAIAAQLGEFYGHAANEVNSAA
jgi:hypothetical protein